MAQNITLQAGNQALQFALCSKNWAQCYLVTEERVEKIGAALPSYLTAQLRRWLSGEPHKGSKISVIENQEVDWILSLSERHCCLYGTRNRESELLYITDADVAPPRLVACLTISQHDKSRWAQQIEEILASAK